MAHGKINESLTARIAYIHGRIDQQIEIYAQSLGIPAAVLAERLATLLHPSGARSTSSVSPLRGDTTEAREAVAAVEVAVRPHGKKASGGVSKQKSGIQAYWASMTPAQRTAETKRRAAKRLENLKKAS